MKRFLIIFSSILLIIFLVFIFFFRTSSGFKSIYLVPDDASLIIETKDPLSAWDKIVHSKAWQHLKTNEALADLNDDIESLDSLVNSSRIYMKLLGKKPVLVSQHYTSKKEYTYLYIVEAGKIANIKKPEKIFRSILGEGFEVTSRIYNDQKIVELLDLEEGSYWFISFIKGKLVATDNAKLLESAIDVADKNIFRNDPYFLDVYSKVRSKGLLSVYINHPRFDEYISLLSDQGENNMMLAKHVKYSGLSFDISEEGLITMESFSSSDHDAKESIVSLLQSGKIELESANVIPERLASLVKLSYTDANDFFESMLQNLEEEDRKEYLDNLNKIEKHFKISLQDNFFSWMEDEIVLLQTQPSNLGRDNEFAVVLHASDSAKASENLSFLWKQIKRNAPVKIKSVDYKSYTIDYLAFPGFLKVLFGKMLEKIEKPYFTQIGDNVIISNHPQTLKNIIDDHLNKATLANSVGYYNFKKNFSDKSSLYLYFEPPVLYYNLKAFVNPETWKKISENKSYITCFNQGGAQINQMDDMIHLQLKMQYQPDLSEWKKQYYNSSEITNLFNSSQQEDTGEEVKVLSDTIPQIIINSLDASKQEEFYDDGALKWQIELKNGLKDGSFKAYHSNGELWIKGAFKEDHPSGKWKYYDEEGELIKTDRY